jgi:UDP-N-acetylmuramyl tripeptide synthase
VAVVTNVGADHLGEYGIDTLAGMADAKLSVALGLRQGGTLVVNFGNGPLREGVERLRQRRADLRVVGFEDRGEPGVDIGGSFLPWGDVPLTLGGLARHNVENALAAIAAARALGISERAIAATLRAFAPSVEDSSGRLNLLTWRGRTVLVDFAHNPDGLTRLAPVVRGLPAQRRAVVLGTAGDRTDAILDDCAAVAAGYGCDRYVVKELAGYLRGRAPGEVPARLAEGLRKGGVPDARISFAPDDVTAAREALAWSRPGDLLVLLVHERLDEVLALLREG